MRNDPAKGGTIQIDGTKFNWSVAREQGFVNTGSGHFCPMGLAIHVECADAKGRPLLLQFEPVNRHRNMPQHQRFRVTDRLAECIQNAVAAGWDPESRGKQFVFQAGFVDATK